MGVEAWLDVDSIAKEHGWSCRVLEWSMVGCGYIENGVPRKCNLNGPFAAGGLLGDYTARTARAAKAAGIQRSHVRSSQALVRGMHGLQSSSGLCMDDI